MHTEQRTRTRVPAQCDVIVFVQGQRIPVKTWNLSLKGLQCSPDPLLKQAEACQILFVLGSQHKFKIQGTIVRASKDEAAIIFRDMEERSFCHLKRLVQLNAPDPDTIDSELANPLKSKEPL